MPTIATPTPIKMMPMFSTVCQASRRLISCSANAYSTPNTADTAPKASTTMPHHISVAPSRSIPTLMMPKMPIFTITPDISAEA
ncbi:hypothetical protein D3C78_1766560 [compost metagenome]